MATAVLMPKLGLTMTEGTIDGWSVKEGEPVKKGDLLYTVSTDKLTNEIEAEEDGVLLKILCPEGETAACKSVVAYIGQPGEKIPEESVPSARPAEQRAPAPDAPAPAAKQGPRTVLVIGGGPGGYVAAIRAAQLGAKVTVIEKDRLGGTCLNVGCIPTKCLLHSAELVSRIREQGAEIGVRVSGLEVDFPQVIAHKDEISKRLTGGIAALFRMNRIGRVEGEASFLSPNSLSVRRKDGSAETMTADAVIIAAGSVNAQPPIPGLRENPNCIDSTGALSLEKLPESMVVIGGGVIGIELACAYSAFGTRVTVIEALDHMLPMLDAEISAVGIEHLKKRGVEFHLECPVQSVEPSPVGAKVVCRDKGGELLAFEAEKVLVAIGRRANTAPLNLDAAGIQNDRGRILVNDRMETNVPGVYAIGDCVFGKAMLAHTASAMGEVAAENIMGQPAVYDQKTNPACVYMEPEAASVGLTEEQCREKGIDYIVGKFPMNANGKALILNGGEGMVKMIADRKYREVLGLHIIGPRATDLISEGALALRLEATLDELITTIHSHPTVTETVREAALHAEGRAIHTKN
ncbi:dihydrolipoyl dehydrogenase [Yanshouia hominis]|uniref:Dihydrolipoyl dehydrogenase n=1 Tax=Yanshouia hominis TaxID=2763673 RepID=A0ABR7NMM7_9FIRM|nr:dihydrolipoyl dehydrogenase [Yanshouia hominis]MBC8577667.1 dihydrolipoyl dehydrogenase [Yanshouia hominis]